MEYYNDLFTSATFLTGFSLCSFVNIGDEWGNNIQPSALDFNGLFCYYTVRGKFKL